MGPYGVCRRSHWGGTYIEQNRKILKHENEYNTFINFSQT